MFSDEVEDDARERSLPPAIPPVSSNFNSCYSEHKAGCCTDDAMACTHEQPAREIDGVCCEREAEKLCTEAAGTCSERDGVMMISCCNRAESGTQSSECENTSGADSVCAVVEFIMQYWKEMHVEHKS